MYYGDVEVNPPIEGTHRETLEGLGVRIGKWCSKDHRWERCRIPTELVENGPALTDIKFVPRRKLRVK